MIVTCCTIFVGRKVIVTNNLTCVKNFGGCQLSGFPPDCWLDSIALVITMAFISDVKSFTFILILVAFCFF